MRPKSIKRILPVVLSALICGCGQPNADLQSHPAPVSPRAAPSTAGVAKVDAESDRPGLHNLRKVTDRIYSGGEPHGEEGFASLEKLGIKTVVSVDGAKPNIELARNHGLRYVHIPFGYDGVPEEAGGALARLVREAQPPFYIHCHHGKHRGPAAAAVACVAAGDMSGKEALEILEHAGTSKDYAGLWRDVEAYEPPPPDAPLPDLVEVAEVDSLTAAMAQVDRAFDNLKLCREAKWAVLSDHPDLVPAQEALMLQEGLHEAARNLGDSYDDQMKAWLMETESLAADLRAALSSQDVQTAGKKSMLLEQACKQCHTKYRDQ